MSKKNQLLNILINLLIPILILTKFSGLEYLGPSLGLIVALCFPLIYGLFEFKSSKKVNFFSIIGLLSVLLTGVIGLFELPNSWLAYKEASIPLIVALILLVSHKFGHSLFKNLIAEALDLKKVFSVAKKKNKTEFIEKRITLSNYLLALVFLASAIINFVLAKLIVKSAPGTEAYNSELGLLTGLSFAIIFIPFLLSFILIVSLLINFIVKKTSLNLDEILL